MWRGRLLLASSLFARKHIPTDVKSFVFKAPTGKIGDTVIANGTLLRLLKEREFVQSRRYDFEIPDFLSGSKKAYEAIAHGFADVPKDWSLLEDLLPLTLLQDLKAYFAANKQASDYIPRTSDKFFQKIVNVTWSMDPPAAFPQMHPFGTIFHLIAAVLFSPKTAKERWTAYLEECSEWYKANHLMVDVMFLVLAEEVQLDAAFPHISDSDVTRTHFWTFCRDSEGTWNVVAMDH